MKRERRCYLMDDGTLLHLNCRSSYAHNCGVLWRRVPFIEAVLREGHPRQVQQLNQPCPYCSRPAWGPCGRVKRLERPRPTK